MAFDASAKSRIVGLLMACACWSGCGERTVLPPSSIAVGDWAARLPNTHTGSLMLRLQQDGSTIRGTACEEDAGFVGFRNAAVTVNYPQVTIAFTPETEFCSSFAGWTFIGRFQSDSTLLGDYFVGGRRESVTFRRGGNLCAGGQFVVC
jgi:hypothetical protein